MQMTNSASRQNSKLVCATVERRAPTPTAMASNDYKSRLSPMVYWSFLVDRKRLGQRPLWDRTTGSECGVAST